MLCFLLDKGEPSNFGFLEHRFRAVLSGACRGCCCRVEVLEGNCKKLYEEQKGNGGALVGRRYYKRHSSNGD